MNKTKIEWAQNPNGTPVYTWNPITGCLNGCDYCYARKLANTRLRSRYLANHTWTTEEVPHSVPALLDPFYPRFWEDRVKQMSLYTGVGKGIFTCDMSDLFGIGIPIEWTNKVLFAINLNRRNRFYLLTKQPQNLQKFSPFPHNCWVGVSATDTWGFDCAFRALMQIQSKVKFISFEPLLNWTRTIGLEKPLKQVDWIIIGSQTQPVKHPPREWVDEIIEAADKARIPVFVKEPMATYFGIYREEFPNR